MRNIIKSIVSSINSKKARKILNSFNNGGTYINISLKKYNRLVKYLKEKVYCEESKFTEAFYEYDMVHIKDDVLAKFLYTQFVENKIELDEGVLHYVVIPKEKKLAFVICQQTSLDFEKMYDQIQNICKKLSTEQEQLYVDYLRLFSGENYNSCFLMSLFNSIGLGKYSLQIEDFKTILHQIYACNFDEIVSEIFKEEKYSLIRQGLFYEYDDNFRSWYDLPSFITVNTYIFILAEKQGKQAFENLEEFFINTWKDNEFISRAIAEEAGIVFDVQNFENCLSCVTDNEAYTVYKSKVPILPNAGVNAICLKVKDLTQANNILDIIKDVSFFDTIHYLYTLDGKIYIFWLCCNENVEVCKYTTIDDILKVICALVKAESEYSKIRSLMYTNPSTDLSQIIAYNEEKNKINFVNIQNIYFEGNIDENLKSSMEHIEFPLFVLKYIDSFNNPDLLLEVAKVFPPQFYEQIEKYLSSGEYNLPKLYSHFKIILENTLRPKLKFFEEWIPVIEQGGISSAIGFLNNVTMTDEMKSYVAKREKQAGKLGEYASVDNIVQSILPTKDIFVTTKTIQNLKTLSDTNYKRLISVSEVVTSKNSVEKNKYVVIGAKLNCPHVYNLYDLLSKKLIQTPDIYKIILNLLILCHRDTCGIRNNGDESLKNIYVTENLDVYFTSTKHLIFNSNNLHKYYNKLLGIFGTYLDCIIELNPNLFSNGFSIKEIKAKLNEFEFCNEHQIWRTKQCLCNECKKTYTIFSKLTCELYSCGKLHFCINDNGE